MPFYQRRLAAVHATWDRIHGDVMGALLAHAAPRPPRADDQHGHARLPARPARRARVHPRAAPPRPARLRGPHRHHAARPVAARVRLRSAPRPGPRGGRRPLHHPRRPRPRARPARARPPGCWRRCSARAASPSSRAIPPPRATCGRAQVGYPGDPWYREFYRDVGFDLPEAELDGELGPNGTRLMTGLKPYRITGPGRDKQPYDPDAAHERAPEHAAPLRREARRPIARSAAGDGGRRRSWSRPSTPSSSATGGSRAPSSWSTCCARSTPRRGQAASPRPPSAATWSASPSSPWPSPRRRPGARAASARSGRAPRQRACGGTSTTRSAPCATPTAQRRRRRARRPRARSGHPRAAAARGQRLGVHDPARRDDPLRRGPGARPRAPRDAGSRHRAGRAPRRRRTPPSSRRSPPGTASWRRSTARGSATRSIPGEPRSRLSASVAQLRPRPAAFSLGRPAPAQAGGFQPRSPSSGPGRQLSASVAQLRPRPAAFSLGRPAPAQAGSFQHRSPSSGPGRQLSASVAQLRPRPAAFSLGRPAPAQAGSFQPRSPSSGPGRQLSASVAQLRPRPAAFSLGRPAPAQAGSFQPRSPSSGPGRQLSASVAQLRPRPAAFSRASRWLAYPPTVTFRMTSPSASAAHGPDAVPSNAYCPSRCG